MKIISEIEIWKSARAVVAHFGDGARARAQTRAEDCESRADIDGWMKWMRIAAAIIELQSGKHHEKAGDAAMPSPLCPQASG